MSYLILPKDQAEFRNWKAAKDDNCKDETVYRWQLISVSETHSALVIQGGFDLLSSDELNSLVDELPSTEIDT